MSIARKDVRDQVFISYSHKDDPYWLERFETMLAPLKQTAGLQIWCDKQIDAGQLWKDEIDAAISRARVALLLVSDNFLASGFINNEELPRIFERHCNDGLFLYWAPITSSLYEETMLSGLQAACAADQPLESLAEAERKQILIEIARDIRSKLGQFDRLQDNAREDLHRRVEALFRDRLEIGEEIGSGDTSVVFRARQGLRELVVKALVPTMGATRYREELKELLERAALLRDPAYIAVHEAQLDQEPACIVRDYVPGNTLAHVLHGRRLPAHVAVSYVHQLARALDEAHQQGMRHGRMTPSNIYLQGDRVRLSPVDLSTQMARTAREEGGYFTTREAAHYISPEYYYGRNIEKSADQYCLALIALEMLQGRPAVPIRCHADLAKLPTLYENPRALFKACWRKEVPGLDRILARMLRKDPDKRWASMREIVEALEPLKRHRQSAEIHLAEAKHSYCKHCQDRPDFYAAFYNNLFKRSRRAKRLFAKIAMERQYRMLDEAIEKLLNFRKGPEPTTLYRVAQAHRRLRLTALDFRHFEEALVETLMTAGEDDAEILASWSAALRPGLDYMSQACATDARPKVRVAKAPRPKAAKPKAAPSLVVPTEGTVAVH